MWKILVILIIIKLYARIDIYKFLQILKDTLMVFDDLKNKQKKCMKECFLICKSIYVLKVYYIHYTLR